MNYVSTGLDDVLEIIERLGKRPGPPEPILPFQIDNLKMLVRVLNLVCADCSHLKISREELEAKGILKINGSERLKRLEKYRKSGS